MHKVVNKYFDILFLQKFLLTFFILFFFHGFFVNLVNPSNSLYSAFADKNLNYIKWTTGSIVYSANLIDHAFGVNSYIQDRQTLAVADGESVFVGEQCLAIGILSFWIAFVLAHVISWKRKVLWIAGGLLSIWFINCWRIALLLLSMNKNWEENRFMDHHDMFNIAAYMVIVLLICFFYRQDKVHAQFQVAIQ